MNHIIANKLRMQWEKIRINSLIKSPKIGLVQVINLKNRKKSGSDTILSLLISRLIVLSHG